MDWSIDFIAFTLSRLLLGGMFFLFGLNAYFNWWALPPASEKMNRFAEHLYGTGIILPVVKVFEIFFGFLLLINCFSFLATLALSPICFFIILSHGVYNRKRGWSMMAFVGINWLILILSQSHLLKLLIQA